MAILCILFLLVAAGVFIATRRLSLVARIAAAVGTFVLPLAAVVVWVAYVGDPAAPGSTIIEVQPK